MKQLHKRILTFVLALGSLGLVIAWMAGVFVTKLPTENLTANSVLLSGDTYTVSTSVDTLIEEATGTISARDETTISSRLLARIEKIHVRAGDTVRAGDVIAELDSRDLQARVEQITQSVNSAQAMLNETSTEFDRIKSLYETGVASRAEFDRTEATLISRKAELERNRQAMEEAVTALSFSTIKSPIDGRIIERLAEPGDTASPGVPLVRIYNPQTLWLNANVRESLTPRLSTGSELYVYIDAIDRILPVIIDEIVPAADPGSRSVTVKVLLPSGETLYPGMFGRLQIPVGQTERLYVPATAVKHVGQLEYVNLVKADRQVSKRYIRTGRKGPGDTVEVVSGLKAGETIVVD